MKGGDTKTSSMITWSDKATHARRLVKGARGLIRAKKLKWKKLSESPDSGTSLLSSQDVKTGEKEKKNKGDRLSL